MNEENLSILIEVAQTTGFSVDLLEFITRGLDDRAVAILLGNVSSLPTYMKSNDIPNRARIFNAPSIDIRN